MSWCLLLITDLAPRAATKRYGTPSEVSATKRVTGAAAEIVRSSQLSSYGQRQAVRPERARKYGPFSTAKIAAP